MKHLSGAVRQLLFLSAFIVSIVLMALLCVFRLPTARMKQRICGAGCRILGLRLHPQGSYADTPVMVVSNHCSYLDILVLNALGDVYFTPKSDIRKWPLVGWITSMFGSIYVDRAAGRSHSAMAKVKAALKEGKRICVFPEATTNNGRELKPFKSAFFALAEQWDEASPLAIQPVSIKYESYRGSPLDERTWPKVAWYGDATLVPHIWQVVTGAPIDVEIICHPPISVREGEARKQLAARAEAIIAQPLGLKTPLVE
jgi:1-acyl-sn-glycerol-3-phosphate acyltransferase